MKIDDKLYRRVQVSLLTRLDDGSLLFPDEIAYVQATPKQIAYAHPRCESCHRYAKSKENYCDNWVDYRHPQEYCSQHTSLLEPPDEIS